MNPSSFKSALDAVFHWALQTSLYATALIALVLLVQFVFRRKLPARWRYALGLLIVLRLVMPLAPASSLSIFNLAKRFQPATPIHPVVVPTAVVPTPDLALLPTMTTGTAPLLPEFPPLASAPAGDRINLSTVLEFLWLAGCMVFLGAAAWRHLNFWSASRRWGTVTEPRVLELLRECQAALGVRRRIRVLNAPGLDTPALFGHFRPALLLPDEMSRRFGDRELRHILLHELVHLRRGDILINWVMIVVRAFHWFNPVVWLAFRRLRADQELACDAAVMGILDAGERRDYGNTLIRVLEEFSAARFCPGLVPFVTRKQIIQRRITMIANFKPAGRAAAAASVTAIVVLGFLTFTRAAEKPAGASGTDLGYRDPWGNPYIITTDVNFPSADPLQRQPAELPLAEVRLPTVPKAGGRDNESQLLEVTIGSDGTVRTGGNSMPLNHEQLLQEFRRVLERNPKTRLLLRIDRNTALQPAQDVFDAAQKAGFASMEIASNETTRSEQGIQAPQKGQSNSSSQDIQRRIIELDAQIKLQEAKLSNLHERYSVPGGAPPEEMAALDSSEPMRRLQGFLVEAENQLRKQEVMYSKLKSLREEDLVQVLPTTIPDAILTQLMQDVNAADARLASLKTSMGSNHPDVIAAREVLSKLNSQLQQRVKGILKGLETQTEAAAAETAQLKARIKEIQQRAGLSGYYDQYRAGVSEIGRLREELRGLQDRLQNQNTPPDRRLK